ncbi:MAG TPA: hypothetical protein VKD91_24115 [Pyrinomonadaceae bacterium]|nr:hypothetical protein [Pyrinomonadaceae bacterium]
MSWDPSTWKKSTRLLLGVVTVWPVVYVFLFMAIIMAAVAYFTLQNVPSRPNTQNIDLLQLEQKIRDGELSQITVKPNEIVACDRTCDCEYHVSVISRATRAEIIRQARETDEKGMPRVPKVSEETSQPAVPVIPAVAFAALFAIHLMSILSMFLLLALYLVLAVKRERFDQTTRIVWIVLICLAGNLAMPVYWFLYVWGAEPVKSEPVTS